MQRSDILLESMQSTLRKALIVVLCLIPFVPLIVANPFFFPFITGKNFAFRILVEVALALWAILALKDASYRPRWSALPILILALLASAGISAFLAENPAKAFWSNFERMEGWVGLFHATAYFFVLWCSLNAEKLWSRFFAVSLGVAGAIAMYCAFQLAGITQINQGGLRVDGTLGNATYLAVYMLFNVFLAIFAYVRAGGHSKIDFKYSYWISTVLQFVLLFSIVQNGAPSLAEAISKFFQILFTFKIFALMALPHVVVWGAQLLPKKHIETYLPRVWYGLVAVSSFVMLFYSATRGAILGIVGGLLLMGLCLVLFGKGNNSLKKWGISAVVGVLVLVSAFVGLKDTPFVQNNDILARLASISLAQGETRLTIWHMAYEGFLERPIFGWGQEGFNYVFNKFYEPSLHSQEPWFDRAHNAFLDWLIAGGAVAFIIYLSFYVIALYLLWRPKSDLPVFEKSLFTGLLAAYAFHNSFVFDNLVSYFLFMTVLAYIGFRSRGGDTAPAVTGPAVSETTYMPASAGIIIVMLGVFYFFNVPGMATASNLIQGLTQHQSIQENFNYLKEASKTQGMGRQEVREQLMQFSTQVRSLNAGDANFQNEVAQFAAQEMANELSQAPNDARLHVFLGSFARQYGNNDLALQELTKAHELSPNKQQIIFELGILETVKNNLQGALLWFKMAYDLAPAYEMARTFYAATAIRAHEMQLVSELLIPQYGNVTPPNDYILQAYVDVKDFGNAVAVAKAKVALKPDDAQTHVQLAATYLQAEDRTNAISELEKAIALKPDFKTQGEYFIQQIKDGTTP